MKKTLSLFVAALVGSLAVAHSVEVQNAWVRLLPSTTTSVYMTLVNPALRESVKIVGVSSPAAAKASFHSTEKVGGSMNMGSSADMTGMRPLASVTIPPKGRLEFKPGGMHVMLEGLKAPLKTGQKVRIVLRYDDGDTQTLEATVRNQ